MLLKPMQPFIMVSVKCWKGWEANEIFKNDCNRGAWKIFTRDGGKPGMGGGGFIMGGWEVFEVLLHSWQGGAKSPVFYEDPLYCLPSLFQILANLPALPCHLQPPPPLFWLPCFFGRMGDHITLDVLFYLTITWIDTCQDLVL